MSDATAAMIRLFIEASRSALASRKAVLYQSSEKLFQTVNFDELKLKTASTSKGTCRNA